MSIFGQEFDKDWPLQDLNNELTPFGQNLLEKCLNVQKPLPDQITIEQFIEKSNEFPLKFPIDTCRVKTQPVERYAVIQQQIESAYPLVHEKVLYLITDFLEHKIKYGTSIEKQLYTNMTPTDFVQRLLIKRCASFVGFYDSYVLLTGQEGCGEKYLKVGTEEEEEPLTLNNVLSYDEIKISALLSVTTFSEFINDGRRDNCGKVEKDFEKIEPQGVVIGLIGARFARPDRMDCEDIKITKTQNTSEKGYGAQDSDNTKINILGLTKFLFPAKVKTLEIEKSQDYRRIWNKFYEEKDHLYKKVSVDNKLFGKSLKCEAIFENLIMKKRYAISFDTLLLEANERALKSDKLAYIHVVGIGLGVWLGAEQQEKIFMECFLQRLKYLMPRLNNIGVVHLSWFHLKEWRNLKDGKILKSDTHPKGGIRVLISKRNPNEKLMPPYEGMLPVVSYAWDGNALPGNEFWKYCLASSNDPSTACSTLITELLNPHINTLYVNGNNLHISSPKYGILHVKDYVETILRKKIYSKE